MRSFLFVFAKRIIIKLNVTKKWKEDTLTKIRNIENYMIGFRDNRYWRKVLFDCK